VEQDCSSEMLIGKKTLIVETTLTFRIFLPVQSFSTSIYGTGKIILGGKTSFRFNTEYETGYINKIIMEVKLIKVEGCVVVWSMEGETLKK
jgi:hypothetical protein